MADSRFFQRNLRASSAPLPPPLETNDIASLVSDIGGNSAVYGIWSVDYGVRLNGSVVCAWEDARCEGTPSRLFAGGGLFAATNSLLNGASKASIKVWVEPGSAVFGSAASFGVQAKLAWFMDTDQSDIWIYVGAGLDKFGRFVVPWSFGTEFEFTVVYDGDGATNADRLKCYYKTFNRTTQTWSAIAAGSLTFTGTIPATLPTGDQNLSLNWFQEAGYVSSAIYDEARLWAGTALSQAQVDAETLTANPVAASLRYTFDSSLANTGTQSGYTLSDVHGVASYVSADRRWAQPLLGHATERPAWNSGLERIEFDDTDDLIRWCGAATLASDFAVAIVSSVPSHDAGFDVLFDWSRDLTPATDFALYTSASQQIQLDGTTSVPSLTASLSGLSGIRVFHARRAFSGGNETVHLQIGSAAEAASSSSAGTAVALDRFTVGANRNGDGETDAYFKGIVVYTSPSSAKRTRINTWASTYLGATL